MFDTVGLRTVTESRLHGQRLLPGLWALALAWSVSGTVRAECVIRSESELTRGSATLFSAEGCGGPGALYRWQFGDNRTAPDPTTEPSVRHTYDSAGIFTIFVRIETAGVMERATQRVAVTEPPAPGKSAATTSIAYSASSRTVWCTNPEQGSVAEIDPATGTRRREMPLCRKPRNLALDPRNRLWVTCEEEGQVIVLDAVSGSVLKRAVFHPASLPWGIVLDSTGSKAYVSLLGLGEVAVLSGDPSSLASVLTQTAVIRTPRALALSHDQSTLFVTRWTSPDRQGEVAVVDTGDLKPRKTVSLAFDPGPDIDSEGRGVPNGLNSLSIHPSGKWMAVPSKKDNIARGSKRDGQALNFESTVREMVTYIDINSLSEGGPPRNDIDDRGLFVASGHTRRGEFLLICDQGADAVLVHDGHTGAAVGEIRSPAFGRAMAPMGLAFSERDSLLFVHYFTTREVGIYDFSRFAGSDEAPLLHFVSTVGKESLSPRQLLGQQLFYHSGQERLAEDKYLSCSACHLDGLDDGRVWDFTDKGEGLRRTTSLRGKAGTAQGPLHWSANFDEVQDFEHDIRFAFNGSGLMSDGDFKSGGRDHPLGGVKEGLSTDLDALAAYVASLDRSPSSPLRAVDGSMTSDARAGEAIFRRQDVGCALCHIPPLYTDSRIGDPGYASLRKQALEAGAQSGAGDAVTVRIPAMPGLATSVVTAQGFLLHDVGTAGDSTGGRLQGPYVGLDTPTLLGVWRNHFFLHDGSAASVLDVVSRRNAGDRHGRTSHLSPQELDQLVAFVMQLGGGEPEIYKANTGVQVPRSPSGKWAGREPSVRYRRIWVQAPGLHWPPPAQPGTTVEYLTVDGKPILNR